MCIAACIPFNGALITWRPDTANGSENSKDLNSRTWPAKGGWTGILENAPLKVFLRAIKIKAATSHRLPTTNNK